MIKLFELKSPALVSDLVNNIKCVVQKGYFLGKDCEVLSEDPKIDQPEILQIIEKTFDRIVHFPAANSEWVQLEAYLMMYDQLLTYRSRNVEMLSCDKVFLFAPLLAKIDEICMTIPKTGEDLALDEELQSILTKCRDQKFAKNYLQALLSYLIVNQRLIETTRKYSHLRLHDLFYITESKAKYTIDKSGSAKKEIILIAPEMIKAEDIDFLSEIDLGLGLRFASVIEEDDQNRIVFRTMNMSRSEVKRTIEVFSEISKKEEISASFKRFVSYTIDFAFWRYLTPLVSNYRNGPYRKEYRAAVDDFHVLFPETIKDPKSMFLEHWPFENIGICKRIFEQNKRYVSLIGDLDEIDFEECFTTKCHLVKHQQLEKTYQQIYSAAHKILFVPTLGMSIKQAKEIFSFQKFYSDRTLVLLSPEEFSGKIPSQPEVPPKNIPEKEKCPTESKAHSSRHKNNKTSRSQEPCLSKLEPKAASCSKKEEPPTPKLDSKASSSSSKSDQTPSLSYEAAPPLPKKGLKFDPRVVVWFADKASALEDPKYKDLPPMVQEKAAVFHSIGLEVLDLLVERGVKSSWGPRRLPHYSLACEVSIQGHLQKYRGIITICFDEKNTIFHYGYTDKPANEIVAEYMKKRFWDLDFPTLDTAKEKPIKLPAKVNPEDGSFLSRKINNHTFELIDKKNKATVLLFLPDEPITT